MEELKINLTFEQAVEAMGKGKEVKRLLWDKEDYDKFIKSSKFINMIYNYDKNHTTIQMSNIQGYIIWTPFYEDLIAKDWYVKKRS